LLLLASMSQIHKSPLNLIVLVAALGYFVDIYDLILFSVVRVPSLHAIGVADGELKAAGSYLLQMQMYGMLAGGVFWGILGDKKGRLATLFGTILLYSIANIANGFIHTYDQYAWLRVIAGFGLAGELGIGITLVSEVMAKENRAIGTALVSGVGICGAVLAYAVSEWGWRQAYWAGGALGLLLLGLRIYVNESGMFNRIKESGISRGDFLSLFTNWKRFLKYIRCIFIGIPVWFVIGIMASFSKEFGEVMGIREAIIPGKAIMFHYIGAAMGSILTGFLSQALRSRRKAIALSVFSVAALSAWFFGASGVSAGLFYFILFLLGIAQGYWAMFITVASEQFGTNIRSTVTTTVPNFVRGSLILMISWWNAMAVGMGIWKSAMIVGIVVILLAFISLWGMEETHDKDLDYTE
jgi:putative MFS transporter